VPKPIASGQWSGIRRQGARAQRDPGGVPDRMGSAVEARPERFAITFADRMPAAENR